MAVRGIGIDVVQVSRLVAALERFGAKMEARLFTPGELEYCRRHKDPLPHLAARFAAKEAAFKAIGTGLSNGVGWKHAEVIQPGGRQPTLEFHGVAIHSLTQSLCGFVVQGIAHIAMGTFDGGLCLAVRMQFFGHLLELLTKSWVHMVTLPMNRPDLTSQ